ncbi:siderophore-iron reductase FhuF [Trinickia sp. NRRL B-1857]|uniref:siderophore-iron reductase FhuF n=1 Tax=Trinickia sp. NRRL B-1857 TaxID=3162879 RepID=UPI003D2985EE
MKAAPCQPFAALVEGSPLTRLLGHVWLGMPDTAPRRDDAFDADLVYVKVDELAGQGDRLLDAMAERYAGDAAHHGRALLSQWSKFYFRLAAPAAIAAAVTLRRPLEMPADRCTVALADGMPVALYLPSDALSAMTNEPAPRYRSFVHAHLRVVVDILAELAHIAPRVLWGNVGNLIDALLDAYCDDADGEQASRDAAWIFGSPCLVEDERNPLRESVRPMTPRSALLPTPFRARRVCCLRYEIPGERQLCASCPLLLTMNDEQIAEQTAID